MTPQTRFNPAVFIFLLGILLLGRSLLGDNKETPPIPYSQFLIYLKDLKVESVVISGDTIQGTLKTLDKSKPEHFSTLKVEDPTLTPQLAQAGVRFESVHESTFFKDTFAWVFPLILMAGFWWFIFGRMNRPQGPLMNYGKSKAKIYVEHDLKTRFSDAAGTDEAKAELQELVDFLKDPSKFNRLGGRLPKGFLLVGPPGTGKTLLARAIAGEANVAFFSINGSEFVEMFVGLGAARVRDLFEQAREHSPCIIFIDELDALGKARGLNEMGSGANDEKEQTLNQLLAELDGFDPSTGVILLAATNRPEVLDPALLRSGRFDRQIVIDKPDRKGRTEILRIHLKKVSIDPDLSLDSIAGLTAGFSGADLENLANEAAIVATRRGAQTVEQKDFTAAIERIIGGLERKSRILSGEEKKRVAYHEMGHATASLALELGETVHKVSVIPRGVGALGYTMRRPTEDRYLVSKQELEAKLAVLLAGRASEAVFFSDISTGAADDLDKATDIARSMVTRFGMSETLGLETFDRETSPFLNQRVLSRSHDYSEHTSQIIDQETHQLISTAYRLALKTLKSHSKFLEESVRALLSKETLEEHELKELWAHYS